MTTNPAIPQTPLSEDLEQEAKELILADARLLTGDMPSIDALVSIDHALHRIGHLPREQRTVARRILRAAAYGWIHQGERATSQAINEAVPF